MWKSLDQKSLAVIIAASILLTGGNLWLHRGDPPLGWVTMHEFGISFDFPQNVPLSINTPPEWNQNYWSGAVQGEDNSAIPEMIGLFWTTGTAATKEEGLISLIEMAKQDTTNMNSDEVKSKAFGDYDAAYIEITITEGEMDIPGIVAAFYDPYGRLMMPYHLGFTGSDLNNMEKLEKIAKTMKFDEPDEPYVLESYWPTEG